MDNDQCTGYPVGNFGIAAEVTPRGQIFSRVLYNPPVLGPWLQDLGRGRFVFECDGQRIADSEFENRDVRRLYPEASAAYSDSRLPGLSVSGTFLAPIKAGDALECSLPVLCAEFEFANDSNTARRVRTTFEFAFEVADGEISLANPGGFWVVGTDTVKIGFDKPLSQQGLEGGMAASAEVDVPARGNARLRFVLACHHPDGYYVDELPDLPRLVAYASENWDSFTRNRQQLVDLLPRTHDEQIDRYLRWYLQAGVLLTRITREHVLTLGYTELNQRDSFWTSWPHMVLWPELEKRMIEESAEFQRENGKIPTTVLPVIEREDDIDINEYFSLRIARHYEWTHDLEFARKLWPAYKLSVEYLKSMDKDGDGLLDQGSFWGDWKDVIGVEGRKAAPHFEFLWLAVLKYGKELAAKLGDKLALEEYSALYERSYEAVNRHVDEGGLWTGSFYTTLWYDGRKDEHVQEDQLIGPLYGVMPEDRVASVYEAMDPSMTEWGIRDTYPYREPFNNVGGDYHNGGVWMFLNFADALSRFVTGYPDGGYEILRRAGEWDLEKWGDYMPAEYLDGNMGANAGKPIQGWDADYYAAVLFGIYGLKMLDAGAVQVLPRIPDTETFDTVLTLPIGALRVKQSATGDTLCVEVRSEMSDTINVRYGAWTSKTCDGCKTEIVGECQFCVAEFCLAAGESRVLLYQD